jgi:hypothetical protein
MRLKVTLLGIPLTAAAMCACAKPPTLTPATASGRQVLVQSLTDVRTRDTAYCQLLGLRLYHRSAEAYPETCSSVIEIVEAPQPAGPPLYIVFTNPGYEMEREPVRRGHRPQVF